MYYIAHSNFVKLLDRLNQQYDVYAPVKKDEQRFYVKYGAAPEAMVVGEVRPFEPLKAFFFLAREQVALGFAKEPPRTREKPLCIVGVKACDLRGFRVQDHVFQGEDYEDPFYAQAREENLILAADCTCAIDTCFCLALDVRPYPQENFDVGLSAVNGGFVVETGSEKGRALVESHPSLFEEAEEEAVGERDAQRARVVREVERRIAENAVPYQDGFEGIIERKYDDRIWVDEAGACVECGACNTICPTCHCFLLYDQNDDSRMARLRLWDSCMLKDFAQVAGGGNPRPKLWMRLRNRFEKKFDYFPKAAGFYACTGCGRCISACPAKIDIRRVLKRLAADG